MKYFRVYVIIEAKNEEEAYQDFIENVAEYRECFNVEEIDN